MRTAVVTDANLRSALYTIRSLGKRGVNVVATEEENGPGKPIGFTSKYCNRSMRTPQVLKEDDFIQFFRDNFSDDVILPCHTNTMLPLSKHLKEFILPIPPYDTLIKAVDKELTFKTAIDSEIPIPRTFFPEDLEEVRDMAEDIIYPIVVKTRVGSGAKGVFYANSEEELIKKYAEASEIQERPIIQEYIKGYGCGLFALYNKSSLRAVFMHKRLREYPIKGGPSSYCESIKDPEILKYGLKLLEALNWHGVAMVEFKVDERDNVPKLMEINPRFWGSMPLATSAGVDFPYLTYKMAVEGDVEPVMDYKLGVKVRFLMTDVMSCMSHLKQTKNKRYLREIITPFFDKNTSYGVFESGDIKPFIYYCQNRLKRFITNSKR